jgi:6-phosphogluconolactonase (cycloisomerase 2 family)
MATVGAALTAPESGWKRYDNSMPLIDYNSNWTYLSSNAWGSGVKSSVKSGSTISFKFNGTKIRIIVLANDFGSTSVSIDIDGTTETFSAASVVTILPKCLAYEKLNLINTTHTVIITTNDSLSVRFDAIDIDIDGSIESMTGAVEATSLSEMKIGDTISCRYTAASGSVGTFSELGTCISESIPEVGSSSPNGLFYFIKADKGLLIADRVVQHTISWDTLNNGKYIEGQVWNDVLIRSLSGGSSYLDNTQTYLSKLPNPSSLPTSSSGSGVTFSPDGTYMVVVCYNATASNAMTIYKRDWDTFTKLANPSTVPTYINGAAFSPDGNYLSVAHFYSPFVTIYKRDGDTFTKLSNPETLPTNYAYGLAFSPDNNYLSVVHNASPYITIYKRSGDTFTKLPNPDVLPTGIGRKVAFSPDSNYMVVGHDSSPYATIYKRSGDTFTKLLNPSTLPASGVTGITFSPNGNYLVVISNAMSIYRRDGDTFTKLANPDVLPSGISYRAAFSPDSNYMVVGFGSTPYILIYKRDGDKFLKHGTVDTAMPSIPKDMEFTLDGNYLGAICITSPYVQIYKVDFNKPTVFVASLIDKGLGAYPEINEWDKYIVNSDLDNKVTKENNNVWHHYDIWSFCMETTIDGTWTPRKGSATATSNTYRVVRGFLNSSGFPDVGFGASNTAYSTVGFRPVLEYIEPDGSSKQSNLYY